MSKAKNSTYPDLNDEGYLAVKLLEVDGDWFMVPNSVAEEFITMSEALEDEGDDHGEHLRLCEKFEERFSALRTGGDINNSQLYRRLGDIVDEVIINGKSD